jgi:predicted nucleic acid-binding protein
MIVVDTNVIAYLFLMAERSAEAQAALRKDPDWAAPSLWRSEFQNVLLLYVRQERLTVDDAIEILGAARDRMQGGEYQVPGHAVLSLAAETGCSAYDCEFAVLARDLAVPLVTVDAQMIERLPDVAVDLATFAAGGGESGT